MILVDTEKVRRESAYNVTYLKHFLGGDLFNAVSERLREKFGGIYESFRLKNWSSK